MCVFSHVEDMIIAVDLSFQPTMISLLFPCKDLGHTVADELQLFTCLPECIPTVRWLISTEKNLSCSKSSSSIYTNQLVAAFNVNIEIPYTKKVIHREMKPNKTTI